MIFYTGWVTAVVLIAAAFSLWLAHDMPKFLDGSGTATIATCRWALAVSFAAVTFVVGWKTNQKKVPRAGPSGKLVEGSPNTLFFVPLQYWAFFYLFLLTCAILVWQTREP